MSEPSEYGAGEPVDDWGNGRIWIDADSDLWIGRDEPTATLLTGQRWSTVIGRMQDADADRLTDALESAGVLEASERPTADDLPGEKVAEAGAFTVAEDADGDYWIGDGISKIPVVSTESDEFKEALRDGGVLEDRPDDPPTSDFEEAPGDVTWTEHFALKEDAGTLRFTDYFTGADRATSYNYARVNEAEYEEFAGLLREHGVLPDADAEPSEEAESGDVTPEDAEVWYKVGDGIAYVPRPCSDVLRVTGSDETHGFMSDGVAVYTDYDGDTHSMLDDHPNQHEHIDREFGLWYRDGKEVTAVPRSEVPGIGDGTDDESRSPEDVAETWIELESPNNSLAYVPGSGDLVLESNGWANGSVHVTGYELLYREYDDWWLQGEECGKWSCRHLREIDGTDLPFEEVPADE